MAFDTSLENLLSLLPALGKAWILGINPSHDPRHILVDSPGNILTLKVTTADVQDRDGAK